MSVNNLRIDLFCEGAEDGMCLNIYFSSQSRLAAFATTGEKTVAGVMTPKNETVSCQFEKSLFHRCYVLMLSMLSLLQIMIIHKLSVITCI